MNQTCKVCGEPAAGFHFGAFTCEGCKSFFGRSYNNLSSISECKNNGECVINKKNRTACKACRLRKCLLVGMSKSGSRYGRRSNWFKIHCLLQEQQQQAAAAAAAVHGNHNSQKTPPPPPTSLSMLGHPGAYPPGLYPPRPNCTKEELMLLGLDDYKHSTASPSVSSPDSHNSDSSVDINVRSNTLLRLGKPMDTTPPMNKDIFLPLPFPMPVMPPPGFLPPSHLLFSGYHPALYPHHQGLLKPAADHAQHQHLMNNTHLANNNSRYTPNHNNNNISNNTNNNNLNNNHIQNNTKAAEELTKRFYLDAVLKSQQRSPIATTTITNTTNTTTTLTHDTTPTKSDIDDDEEEDADVDSEELVVAMTPPRSPCHPMQDDPIDLSMKTGSSSSSKSSITSIDDNRQLSGGESDVHSEDNDDDDETTTTTITTTIQKRSTYTGLSNNISDDDETEYERDMKRIKMQVTTTPLDLTTRV